MSITYRFTTPVYPENILYVNIIPHYSCINDCLFCSRPRDGREDVHQQNIYEQKAGTSLYLAKLPSVDAIVHAIEQDIQVTDTELAFVGLGESLQFLPTVLAVLKYVKGRYGIKTRVDTNGLVTCRYPNAAEQLAHCLDEIRISLNAINSDEYNVLCRPRPHDAFKHLTSFVRQIIDVKIDTHVSFVADFSLSRTREEYTQFAESLGIQKNHIIFRDYIPFLSKTFK